jgi:hypothetical protein
MTILGGAQNGSKSGRLGRDAKAGIKILQPCQPDGAACPDGLRAGQPQNLRVSLDTPCGIGSSASGKPRRFDAVITLFLTSRAREGRRAEMAPAAGARKGVARDGNRFNQLR